MSLQDDRDATHRRKRPAPVDPAPAPAPAPADAPRVRRGQPSGDVGRALRSAYRKVVEEDVPPEMLDLLGKLD